VKKIWQSHGSDAVNRNMVAYFVDNFVDLSLRRSYEVTNPLYFWTLFCYYYC